MCMCVQNMHIAAKWVILCRYKRNSKRSTRMSPHNSSVPMENERAETEHSCNAVCILLNLILACTSIEDKYCF